MFNKLAGTAAFKGLLAVAGLAAVALGPWGVSSASRIWSDWNAKPSPARPSEAGDAVAAATASGEGAATPQTGQGPATPPKNVPLADALRFDMTLRDLTARWPRVSTSLADLQLQGYRVPLVTGTSQTDLAGSLTYYFNPRQQVQRITFQGTTGDGTELVRLLTVQYGFRRRLTNDPSIFVYEVPAPRGEAQSVLFLKVAPVLAANRPRQRFDVSLVMERPGEESVVSRPTERGA